MRYDYIVVGQGIAGTMLSHALIKRNKRVLVVDKPIASTSLAIGGGMYSSIIFKRFTKAWMVDTLIPVLKSRYIELEKLLGVRIFYQKDILRIFASEQEKSLWAYKSLEEPYWNYLDDEFIEEKSTLLNAPLGYGRVKDAGTINLFSLLTAYRKYLKQTESLIEDVIYYNDFQFFNNHVEWKGFKADKILFCEGYIALKNNPFFKELPFVLAKGELIIIRASASKIEDYLLENYIISSSVNISSVGNGEFIVGSTYSWNDLDPKPTEKGKHELLTKLSKVLLTEVEVLDQFAGIRPTVKDRRPLIGMHPQYPQLGIFNGMGTKGVMLAPYFAEHFANHLENQADLLPEVYAFRDVKEDTKA